MQYFYCLHYLCIYFDWVIIFQFFKKIVSYHKFAQMNQIILWPKLWQCAQNSSYIFFNPYFSLGIILIVCKQFNIFLATPQRINRFRLILAIGRINCWNWILSYNSFWMRRLWKWFTIDWRISISVHSFSFLYKSY